MCGLMGVKEVDDSFIWWQIFCILRPLAKLEIKYIYIYMYIWYYMYIYTHIICIYTYNIVYNVQGIHKRMVRFQKLTRNIFLTLHGHNVHRQQQQLSKFLTRYQQFAQMQRHLRNWPRSKHEKRTAGSA